MTNVFKVAAALGAGAIVFSASAADAALMLTLTAKDTAGNIIGTQTIVDGGDGSGGSEGTIADTDGIEKVISVNAPVGNFQANFTTAVSTSPASSGGQLLTLTDVSISGEGTLTIRATDDGFDPLGASSPLELLASQTVAGNESIEYAAGINGADLLSIGPLTGNASDEINAATANLSSQYSAFLQAEITREFTDPIVTQFNASLSVVPLPAAGLLLLSGLGALGIAGRRRRNAATA